MLLYLVAMLVSGIVILAVGYWLSDLAYEADLWPVGAVMRVCLLLFFLGWALAIIGLVITTIGSLFAEERLREDSAEEVPAVVEEQEPEAAEEEQPSATEPAAPPQPRGLVCPNCGYHDGGDKTSCPHCGMPLIPP